MTYGTILHALGWLILALAAAMVAPWLVALSNGETEALAAFSGGGLTAAFTGGVLVMGFRGGRGEASKPEVIVLVACAWIVAPVFSAIPFWAGDAVTSLTDAYFEAVSGLTTTGATIIQSLDQTERAFILWRSVLQWLGGWGFIVMAAIVLVPLGVGGMQLRVSPLTRGDATVTMDRFKETAEAIGGIYLAFTFTGFLLVWMGGIPPFDALCLALSSISTGGFLPTDAGLSAYDAPLSLFALAVIMLIGASNFATHRAAFKGRQREYREDPEIAYLFIVVMGAGIFVTIAAASEVSGVLEAFGAGFFTAVSLVTSTGMVPANGSALEGLSPIVLIALILVGGATLSTSGGLKLMRIALLVKQSSRELKRLTHPRAVIATRFGSRSLNIQIMKSVWTLFILFLLVYGVIAMLLSSTGLATEGALVAAAAAISNAGPAYDIYLAGQTTAASLTALAPPYAFFTDGAKWILIAAMIMGRVELLLLMALFNSEHWRH